jgi:hypothetical protein
LKRFLEIDWNIVYEVLEFTAACLEARAIPGGYH